MFVSKLPIGENGRMINFEVNLLVALISNVLLFSLNPHLVSRGLRWFSMSAMGTIALVLMPFTTPPKNV